MQSQCMIAKIISDIVCLLYFNRTEIDKVENELEKALKEADQANIAKSEFLSKMSHELRTPLNAIIALSGVLGNSLASKIPEDEYQYIEVIQRSGNNLLELINDILDISRIESGLMEMEIKAFDLNTVFLKTDRYHGADCI